MKQSDIRGFSPSNLPYYASFIRTTLFFLKKAIHQTKVDGVLVLFRMSTVYGILQGKKGQNFLFDTGVINMLKYSDFKVELHCGINKQLGL